MVKILSQTHTSVAQDTAATRPPIRSIRVCMHVLGRARTDVRVMREATALVEAGFDVSIIDVESEHSLHPEEKIQGTIVKHIVMPSWSIPTHFKPWFLVKAARILFRGVFRLVQVPADIYHAHDVTALPACYIAARLRRKPLIFDAHELPLSEQNVTRWRRLQAIAEWFLARMVPYCVGVITVSPPIAKEIHRRYHGPEMSLVRNVPVYRVVEKNERLRQYLGLSPETGIALYQGALHADRELDRLIRAARFLEQDIVIALLGDGPREVLSYLQSLIASEEVSDRVKILPAVSYEELLDWTASADIGLIIYSPDHSLNVRMCLPNKLFEYLMVGLPVLSAQLDVVADIIKTYKVGQVVSSLEPSDIGKAISKTLADPASLARMSANAIEAVQRDFNWEKERQQLIRLYDDILTKRNKD